jgi:hypothetical protein
MDLQYNLDLIGKCFNEVIEIVINRIKTMEEKIILVLVCKKNT